MSKIKFSIYTIVAFLILSWKQPDMVKKVTFYQGKVSIEVPSRWKYQESFRKFSNQQIKYDAKISDQKTKSILTVILYDSSHMYNTPIDGGLIDNFKEIQLKTKGESLKFIESEIVKVENHNIGILKYTFTSSKNKICYGIQLFFRTSVNDFYEMEIYSLGKSAIEFQKISDRIVESLHFN